MLLTDEQRVRASNELIEIVRQFNSAYGVWMTETGCVANFGWKYGSDQSIKTMEVQSIDAIVYRKPPPNFESLAEKLRDTTT
jgi:hypothetical protein